MKTGKWGVRGGGRERTLIGFFPSESWNEYLAQSFASLCMKVQVLLRI